MFSYKHINDEYKRLSRHSKLGKGRPRNHNTVLIIIGVFGSICVFSLYWMNGLQYLNDHVNVQLQQSYQQVDNFNDDPLYFVKTSGCRMPRLPLYDDLVHKHMESPHYSNCQPPPPLTKSDHHLLWIEMLSIDLKRYHNVMNVTDLVCYVTPFERIDDRNVKYHSEKVVLRYGNKIQVHSEFALIASVEIWQIFIHRNIIFLCTQKKFQAKKPSAIMLWKNSVSQLLESIVRHG